MAFVKQKDVRKADWREMAPWPVASAGPADGQKEKIAGRPPALKGKRLADRRPWPTLLGRVQRIPFSLSLQRWSFAVLVPKTCLIGHTGFVGGALGRQFPFDEGFNSGSFRSMAGQEFSLAVCCGVSAVKWRANQDPDGDRAAIRALAGVLETVRADRFILISTVDVYPVPFRVDEGSGCRERQNHAYGTNRLEFEETVRGLFPRALILRLPALFGAGLRKNVVYDLLHGNCLDSVNPASSFQWYDVARLWGDIQVAEYAGEELVNLVTEPVTTGEIIDRVFPGAVAGAAAGAPQAYDVRTRHAAAFGGTGGYVAGRAECLDRLAAFVAAERGA